MTFRLSKIKRVLSQMILVILVISLLPGFDRASAVSPATNNHGTGRRAPDFPLFFEANHGQDGNIGNFLARGANYQFSIAPGEARLTLRKATEAFPPSGGGSFSSASPALRTIQMQFSGANPRAIIRGADELPGKINYLVGADSKQWHTGISTFRRVQVEELYPGIALVYYGNQQQLEYDFTIAPGADPCAIAIRFEGADSLAVAPNGDLLVKLGRDEIRQAPALAFQRMDGVIQSVNAGYQIKGTDTVLFAVSEYDHNLPLIIDPLLTYSTYVGGIGGDVAVSVKVDSSGSVYMAGLTLSQIPVTNALPGSFQGEFQGGKFTGDGFIAKFDNTLTNFIYLTYLGGTLDDGIYDIAVDAANNAYVTGFTDSTNFPVLLPSGAVPGLPHAGTISGTPDTNSPHFFPTDAFITALDASGSNLLYSFYIGGSDVDVGSAIAVDATGNAFVGGYTHSTNFPTVNGFQTTLAGTNHTVNSFVARIAAGGTNVDYSTYLGGTNFDQVEGIALDSAGFAYVTGFTSSSNFPTTSDALRRLLNNTTNLNTAYDVFISKLDTLTSGTPSLVYSTYFGGTNADAGNRITIDAGTNVYVTGYTYSLDFPNTITNLLLHSGLSTNPLTARLNSDAFLSKFSFASQPPSIVFSTVFGGTNNDMGWDVALDPFGNSAYVVGITASSNFPIFDAFGALSTTNSGSNDVFITVFTNDASSLLYSAYLGGSGNDFGFGVAADADGSAYIVGRTLSTNFPTVMPLQASRQSSNSAFLAKIVLTNRLLTITIQTAPTNLVFTLDGTNYLAPVTFTNWFPGTPRTLTTPAVQIANDVEYVWTNWSDGGFLSHTIVPVSDSTITGNFLGQPPTNHVALVINGGGTISPNLNGKVLNNGQRYVVTAKPATGYLFSNWSGDIVTNTPSLAFVMENGLILQANFVANPFLPVQGNYAGLFSDTNGVAFESSGFFSETLGSQGTFSAKLQLAGKSYSFSGRFSLDGFYSNSIPRKGLSPLTVSLRLDFSGANILTGEISDGNWTAALVANRAFFSGINPAPESAFGYTLIIPGGQDASVQPGGDGFGNPIVDAFGNVRFSGTLGDGTKISQRTFISRDGLWPFYSSLYGGKGSIIGWLAFFSETNTDINGALSWFKLAQPQTKLYPAGFSLQTTGMGSFYSPAYFLSTNGSPILNFTNGILVLEGGNLSQSVTNQITLSGNNKITNQSSNKLTLTISSGTGRFNGSVVVPDTRKTIQFNGAVLQKQNRGAGFFLGTNQSGRVILVPQ